MHNGSLVAMIDACLERLHAARTLLSTAYDTSAVEDLLKSSQAQITKTKKKVRPAIATKKKRMDELTASLFEATPEIATAAPSPAPAETMLQKPVVEVTVKAVATERPVVVTPRLRTVEPRRSLPPVRRKTEAVVSALVSHVPAGPVCIPAAQVREHTQKQAEAKIERTPDRPSESAPLTAEALAKRWIQSARF